MTQPWVGEVEFNGVAAHDCPSARFNLAIDLDQVTVTIEGQVLGVAERSRVRAWLCDALVTVATGSVLFAGRGHVRTISADVARPQDLPFDVVSHLREVV